MADVKSKNVENEKLANKGMKAAKAYLENKGYEVVDVDYKCPYGQIDVVSKFEDVLAFTSVSVYRNDQNKLPKERFSDDDRQRMEQIMAHYLANHDYVDMSVRWDNMSILVITDDRALLRYHVNALGGEANLPVIDEKSSTKERVSSRAKDASKAPKKGSQDKSSDTKDLKPKDTPTIKE